MKKFEDLWDEFDTKNSDEHNTEKSKLCQQMFEITEGKTREEIQLELNLLWFLFVVRQLLEHIGKTDLDKLTPYLEPFIQKCNEKTFEYYEKRRNETKSLLNKWRYSFACWIIPLKKNPVFIEDSISLLISCSMIHLKEKNHFETVHFLVSAFNLSKLYNIRKYDADINEAILTIFYSLVNTEHARWMIEPVEVFAILNRKADYNLINNMITILHREANKFFTKNDHHLHRSLLKASIELCNLTNLDTVSRDKLRNEIHTMIAESHEDEANRANNPMIAVSFYRDAQVEYERAGKHEKVLELSEKIRKATGEIVYDEVRYEMILPELKLNGTNGYQLAISFCNYSENIPSLEWVTNQTKDMMKKHPIQSLFSTITFNRNNPISYANDDESNLESRIKQQTIQFIRLAESRLYLEVKRLEEEKKITELDFITFLTDIGLYEEDQLTIIKSGIADHFRGDYISSIHTLIPQLEGTLRLLLKMKGVSTLKTKRDIMIMDSELGSLLAKPEVVQILGEDFLNYLKVKYADPDGINLRNSVSHALSPLSDFNYETSITLVQTIFKLAKLSV